MVELWLPPQKPKRMVKVPKTLEMSANEVLDKLGINRPSMDMAVRAPDGTGFGIKLSAKQTFVFTWVEEEEMG